MRGFNKLMNRFPKWMILVSSIVITLFLGLEAWRENLNMEWQKYQHKYREELIYRAQSEPDRVSLRDYEIELRQIVVPELKSFDRCITCHVAIEDSRMKDMPNPLKAHPGDYLDTHDMNKIGCTSCHDGQGRAVTFEDAHAKGVEKFWEKPLLRKPFIEATCVRCHADALSQTPAYNLGKQLFQQKACFACHSIGDIGGVKGPALSDIGNASFHAKMPIPDNRHRLLEKFDQNVNLAYLYEAIAQPDAQPQDTLMKITPLSEEEIIALMVYLKSLSAERRAMDIGVSQAQATGPVPAAQVNTASAGTVKVTGASSKGYLVFSKNCVACHTIGQGDRIGPDLKGVTSRREYGWIKNMIKDPVAMIESKDPAALELLRKYKTPMVGMGLTDEQVDDVIQYLKNPEDISITADGANVEGATAQMAAGPKKATQAEIAKGAALFQGKQRFFNRGPSCIACHDVRNSAILGGGALAKELTDVHARLGSMAIAAILNNPPFLVMKEAYKNKPLKEDEITTITAFLEKTNEVQGNQLPGNYQSKMLLIGSAGFAGLLGFCCFFWFNRKRKSVNAAVYSRQKGAKKNFKGSL